MSIRDCSNLPDDHPMVPEWVRQARERNRELRKRHKEAKEDWPRICAEIEASTAKGEGAP